MENSYDEVPYPDLSYVQTHPDRLATLATIIGMDPPHVGKCRVLELGAAAGGNLLPMAYQLPESEFVGIDNSARQIEMGKARVVQLGLSNLTLHKMDILDGGETLGQFDYIVAHGVYSWVPEDVRDAMMRLIKLCLAPTGIAYVSYNTNPGWHVTGIIRDAMLFRTQGMPDPARRAQGAREVVQFIAAHIPEEFAAYASMFRSYVDVVTKDFKGANDAFLLHDELETVNHAVYFHEFVDHARQHDLQYLIEAELKTVLPDKFSAAAVEGLQAMARDAIELEQYMDFMRNRMFRQTLLCHGDLPLSRILGPEGIQRCYVTSKSVPSSDASTTLAKTVGVYKSPDGSTLAIDHSVSKAAMLLLAAASPSALHFSDLLETARSMVNVQSAGTNQRNGGADDAIILASNLLRAYSQSTQLVDLHTFAPAICVQPNRYPLASAVARFEAATRPVVTNLWHERVHLDGFRRQLIMLLDGSRSEGELEKRMMKLVRSGTVEVDKEVAAAAGGNLRQQVAKQVNLQLRWFAHAALLVN